MIVLVACIVVVESPSSEQLCAVKTLSSTVFAGPDICSDSRKFLNVRWRMTLLRPAHAADGAAR